MGISPIAFSKELLTLWGGSLTKTTVTSAPPSNNPQPLVAVTTELSQPKGEASGDPHSAFDKHDESAAAEALMPLLGNS